MFGFVPRVFIADQQLYSLVRLIEWVVFLSRSLSDPTHPQLRELPLVRLIETTSELPPQEQEQRNLFASPP
jgi:hypothetical protein